MLALFRLVAVTSLLGWACVGLRLDGHGGDSVYAFLGLIALLVVAWSLALWSGRRLEWNRRLVLEVAVFSVLFRLAVLPAGLPPERTGSALAKDLGGLEIGWQTFSLYDDDLWRYLWEGHLVASGGDPYRSSPAAVLAAWEDDRPWALALLEPPWIDVIDEVGYPGYRAVYPPGAQLLFAAAHWIRPGSIAALKLQWVGFDLLACGLLWLLLGQLGGPRWPVLLYAWNPLVIKEIAGSGHLDSALVAALVGTVVAIGADRRVLAGIVAGASLLIKPTAFVLAIPLARRLGWRGCTAALTVVVIGWLPWLGSFPAWLDNLRAFSTWVFNPGPWLLSESIALLCGLPEAPAGHFATLLAGIALALLVVRQWHSDDGSLASMVEAAMILPAALVLLSPAVMPWYLLWSLPFAASRRNLPVMAMTVLAFLSYLTYVDGVEKAWWLWLEYGGFAAVLAHQRWRRG